MKKIITLITILTLLINIGFPVELQATNTTANVNWGITNIHAITADIPGFRMEMSGIPGSEMSLTFTKVDPNIDSGNIRLINNSTYGSSFSKDIEVKRYGPDIFTDTFNFGNKANIIVEYTDYNGTSVKESVAFNHNDTYTVKATADKSNGVVTYGGGVNLTRGGTSDTWVNGDVIHLIDPWTNNRQYPIYYFLIFQEATALLDKTAPTATHTLNTYNWSTAVNINVVAQDSGWGMKSMAHSWGSVVGSNISLAVGASGTYMFTATDTANNILYYPVTVSNIDASKPTVYVNMSIV